MVGETPSGPDREESGSTAAGAWDGLGSSMQAAMTLAWESVCAGSFGIGAVVTTIDGEVVATGRNRILESDAGEDLIAGSSLAHAEMNALSKLPYRKHRGAELVLHTTLEPCLQCLGAIRMSDVGQVRVLAPDPLFRDLARLADISEFLRRNWPVVVQRPADEWTAFSLLLPTHLGVFWGQLDPLWSGSVPKLSVLAEDLVAEGLLVEAASDRADVVEVVADLWPRLGDCVPDLERLIAPADQ